MASVPPFEVSVIIPVYNAEPFLDRAVASALAQPEVREIILVEDASTDASLAVCQQLAAAHPDRVRLLQHPEGKNHGAGPSRNRGIDQARFPFIAFLDADDAYLPGRFARDAEMLQADATLDGVYNALGTDIQDEAGRQWWRASGRSSLTTIKGHPAPEQLFFAMSPIGRQGHFHLDTLTVRRQVFERVRFSDLRLAQDTLLAFQLAALFRLAGGQTETPIALRGVHGGNRIRDGAALRAAAEKVLQELIRWAQETGLSLAHRRALHLARLAAAPDWSTLGQVFRQCPALLLQPRAYAAVVQWTVIRQHPNDPFLPGLFPARRRRSIRSAR